jgi:predicted nucleotidyltransferase
MRTASEPLGDLIFGQTRGRILARIFGHPDEKFYVRQIARDSGTSVGTVQRELETLFQTGLIVRSMSGRQVYYQANRNHPVFAEIRSLVAKTVGIFQILRSALTPFADRVSLAFLYGSVARRAEGAESDVDLMVVGDVTLDEILAQSAPAERAIGRTINPTVYSTNEFKAKLQGGNHFLRSVMRGEKVILIGDEDEFGKMG